MHGGFLLTLLTFLITDAAGLHPTGIKRVLTNIATFSHHHTLRQLAEFLAQRLRVPKEDLRLWKYPDEVRRDIRDGQVLA